MSGRRSELVLAYLAVEHLRSVSREELADALWPAGLPDSWAAALRSVATEVRRFLELGGLDPNEMLVTERGGYRLQLLMGVTVDVDEVREAQAQAQAALAAGDATDAAAHADRAARLAGLPFLPHHEGDWVDGVRDALRAAHVAALETAVHAHADSSTGDGPIDATFQAINAATGTAPTLSEFAIGAVTEGQDALGEVSIVVELAGDTGAGQGVSTDIIDAAARAYVRALSVAVARSRADQAIGLSEASPGRIPIKPSP